LSDKAKAVLQRLHTDFPFFAKHCCKIRPKNGDNQPFVLNSVQKRLDDLIQHQLETTGKVRIVILKARQQGLSTYCSAWIYWRLRQEKAKKGLVIAHSGESVRTLFKMYHRLHSEMPEFLRPSTKYASARELHFDQLDTGLKVDTASGHGVARGETINYAHLSEAGKWNPAFAADNFNALMQAIPSGEETGKGTAIFVESTANGMSGTFYDLWQGAVAGKNGFYPFFSPWFESEYREPVPDDFERTYEEEDLVERYGLDDGQLCFRRLIISQQGIDNFEQEYPSNAEEAFKASGRPVFDPVEVHQQLAKAKPLLYQMAVDTDIPVKHSRGELLVYIERDEKESYTIGADVAMGLMNGDYSVAQVLDSKRRQVAVWRGHIQPDAYALVLKRLGVFYNNALIAPEANNHGILTAVELSKNLKYTNVFKHVVEGQTKDRATTNIGFRTTHVTKPLIIDRLRSELRQDTIEINDPTTLKEMLSYIVTDSGGFEAQAKCFDDCVMSLAIANHLLVAGAWKPVRFDEDCYFDPL